MGGSPYPCFTGLLLLHAFSVIFWHMTLLSDRRLYFSEVEVLQKTVTYSKSHPGGYKPIFTTHVIYKYAETYDQVLGNPLTNNLLFKKIFQWSRPLTHGCIMNGSPFILIFNVELRTGS